MIRLLAYIISIAVILCSLLRLESYILATDLLSLAEKSDNPSKELSPDFKKDLDLIVNARFTSFDEFIRLSRIYSELGETAVETTEKLEYLCKTELALRKAVEQEPLNARSLVTWASIKQLLQNYQCQTASVVISEASTIPDWEKAVNLAVKSAPIDQQVLFNAGLVLLWGKKADQAYPIFARVLDLGTDTSAYQREVIYNLVTDSASLAKLIPAKIPQLLEFLRYLKSSDASDRNARKMRAELTNLEARALNDFGQRYARKEIDQQLYQQRLSELWELVRGSPSTAIIDSMLYKLFDSSDAKDLAKFFEHRADFKELPILVANRMADSRPQKSALSDWGSQKVIALDNFFTSVGFFLPSQSTLRRIELHSSSYSPEPVQSLIRVLVGDDNQSWEDITGLCTISTVVFNSKMIVKIDLPGSARHFWKISFQNSARSAKFFAAQDYMLRALGIGATDD